ncbi:MAG: hypothetical protein ACK4FB_11195 [Brevundimonas sp.]|uniref:hypothetical protein n=1 Tax=Brevundimonas sp. TaxID=1871086 RepID=UPI00391D8AB6
MKCDRIYSGLFTLLVAAGLCFSTGGALAQEAPGEPEATQVAPVTVEGRRLADQVRNFVGEVAAAPRGQQLARWDGRVCVGTVNLDPRYGQFMIDRVVQTAVSVGLESGEPGCRPDILIIATNDGDQLARSLVQDSPSGFRPARGGTDLGRAALRRFQNTDAPVRWWHVSLPVSVDTGEIAAALDGEEYTTISVRDASRLRSNTRDELRRVIIILDVSRIGVVSFGALSDYVAMIALAQVDPQADTSSYPSVLNLFNDLAEGAEAGGLTDWDRDYLTGLYRARDDRARSSQQEREIAREMMRASDGNED